ncbi:hypothetical protein BISA_0831 [Bifidobacterium saguini DSM 23967]|uniref:Uncharacterized protein n=2 Tax=Bifidobacterium saguini TaxID=762210 RepID=A0A087DA81_9BIFI|nr:hypothetical protein [Bifidobacterium saguini]KFI92431.1 hypothetical protein BISA_0831 [Bifidobacterium saguini DSM 23967]QTB90842.1 hypothetical protein BSD967_11265 [Bifidobacterium saguini]QTB90891.1 hypothetical protein BSD967_00035 [Bifidobacterium saguini]
MQRCEYICSTGESLSFEGPIYGETMPSLRGRAWAYSLGARTLSGVAWQARELTLTVKAVAGETELDRLRMLADHDVLAHATDPTVSGLLRVDDEWECRALIVRSEPQSITPRLVEIELTVTQLGRWRRSLPTIVYAPSDPDAYAFLDYPHDMDYDYGPPSAPPVVAVDGLDPLAFRMTILGPCSDPTVTIGSNRYRITGDIPGGASVEVNAVEGERSVIFVTAAGDRINWFANAERGSGMDSGSYIFQPLPAGRTEVSWPGGFTFELTPVEERSEPPWSAS